MASSGISLLLENAQGRFYLKKLSLISAKLNFRSMQLLSALLEKSSIESLDISWNGLQPMDFNEFLEALASNRKLKHLNLSWNQLVHPLVEKKFKRLIGRRPFSLEAFTSGQVSEADFQLGEHEIFVAQCLTKFIKYNTNLLHLNLQSASLSAYLIVMIGNALRKSMSLAGVHLCDNPGVTPETLKYLWNRIRCKKGEFEEMASNPEPARAGFLRRKTDHGMKELEETMHLKEIHNIKRAHCDREVRLQDGKAMCVLVRYNGHKGEMRNTPQQWQMLTKGHEKCWVCDKWIYSLVFYSSRRSHPGISPEVLQQSNSVPCVRASFTNQRPVEMYSLLEFIDRVEEKYGNSASRTAPDTPCARWSSPKGGSKLDIEEVKKRWNRVLAFNLRYKQPFLLNLEEEDLEDPENLYVLPYFVQCGRQHMHFDHDIGGQELTCSQKAIVDFRTEDVPPFSKATKRRVNVRKFVKQKSVFKDWIEDTSQTYQKCLEHDF